MYIYIMYLRLETWFIHMCNMQSHYVQMCIICNTRNAGEQTRVSQMSASLINYSIFTVYIYIILVLYFMYCCFQC